MAERERIGLENLSPPEGSRPSSRRVGRGHGSGSGKTSGRGHKGQKARSGSKSRAWFEGGQMPLYRRTPKRGFKNPGRTEWSVVNLADLDRIDGNNADPDVLHAHGLISSMTHPVKVLARGEIARAMTIQAHGFSAAAREKIEAAGGTAQVIE
jgi:large subunit ribosomal protein L15